MARRPIRYRPGRRYGPYRRPWRWKRRSWLWPYPRYWSWPATMAVTARLGHISRAARRSLRDRGLLYGVWSRRLANARPQLVRFINRFHRVPGFEWVVRAYYDRRYSQPGTRHLMRTAHHIADRSADVRSSMRFRRTMSYRINGLPVRAIDIVGEGVHYRPLPWSRISPRTMQMLLRHDMNHFSDPARVRWVFSGRLLGMSKRGVVRTVHRALIEPYSSANGNANRVHWLEALNKTIIVV